MKLPLCKKIPNRVGIFLKKIGSNFRLSGQKLFLDFKNAFKILAEAEPERSESEATLPQNAEIVNWRRREDSNLRCPCGHNGFRDHPFRPLRHASRNLPSFLLKERNFFLLGKPRRVLIILIYYAKKFSLFSSYCYK